jgi:hypothetical protein
VTVFLTELRAVDDRVDKCVGDCADGCRCVDDCVDMLMTLNCCVNAF